MRAMRSELPSGTVTFLFTDVEGSTALLHELGAEGYASALAEHRRVVREAFAAQGGVVTGVDISAEQVRRARAAVPDADLVHADITSLELAPRSFDAVVSFYAFNHIPRELLAPTFARIGHWLVPGGLLMTALGVGDTEAWTGEWLGAPTFFSSFPHETNTRLVREAGFEILRDELVTFREPEGDVTFQWVLAMR